MATLESDRPNTIDPTALAERLGHDEGLAVIDVRRPERWSEDQERIPGSVWIPYDEVARRAEDLPADRDLVIYCS